MDMDILIWVNKMTSRKADTNDQNSAVWSCIDFVDT